MTQYSSGTLTYAKKHGSAYPQFITFLATVPKKQDGKTTTISQINKSLQELETSKKDLFKKISAELHSANQEYEKTPEYAAAQAAKASRAAKAAGGAGGTAGTLPPEEGGAGAPPATSPDEGGAGAPPATPPEGGAGASPGESPYLTQTPPVSQRTRAARALQLEFRAPLRAEAPTGSQAVVSGTSSKSSSSGGSGVAVENAPAVTVSLSVQPAPAQVQQAQLVQQPLANVQNQPVPDAPEVAVATQTEPELDQNTLQSTQPNELSANELATLDYQPNFTEVMDASNMRFASDASRGNLGAGTSAEMQSADLWGNQFTQHAKDIVVQPEKFLTTTASGTTVEESSDKTEDNIYSFLPFAKLGGDLIWIPRHTKTARFFFTSDDYLELVSHIRDGDPLTLDKTEEVDTLIMMNTIIKSYGTLKMFCELSPMLPMSASVEQIYAEWLEMRQIGKSVIRYQQISGGTYQNAELSMKSGIRAAVASALRPFVEAWNKLHQNDQIATDMTPASTTSGPMFTSKRKAPAGIVAPEEYNPQFTFENVDFKRIKFSVPTI